MSHGSRLSSLILILMNQVAAHIRVQRVLFTIEIEQEGRYTLPHTIPEE